MSVTAGPGRTWSFFITECRLFVLVTALAAGFPHGSARIARLSGLARAAPAALFPHLGSQGDFWRQPDSESRSAGVLERAMVSLLVKIYRRFLVKGQRVAGKFGNGAAKTDLAAAVPSSAGRCPRVSAGKQGDGGCEGNYLTFLCGGHGDRSKTPGWCRQDLDKHLGAEIPSYL